MAEGVKGRIERGKVVVGASPNKSKLDHARFARSDQHTFKTSMSLLACQSGYFRGRTTTFPLSILSFYSPSSPHHSPLIWASPKYPHCPGSCTMATDNPQDSRQISCAGVCDSFPSSSAYIFKTFMSISSSLFPVIKQWTNPRGKIGRLTVIRDQKIGTR